MNFSNFIIKNSNQANFKWFGTDNEEGSCSWVSGCGSSAQGTHQVRKIFYFFGLGFPLTDWHALPCKPDNGPC